MTTNTEKPRCPTCSTPWGFTRHFSRRRSLLVITISTAFGAAAVLVVQAILGDVR